MHATATPTGNAAARTSSPTQTLLDIGTSTAPPAPAVAATSLSVIADPLPELAPVAPLSPQLPTQFATSSVAQPNLALSPGGSAASPSESAPSAPGGGGKTLADCMGFWDRETHMTKTEWRAACVRSMREYPSVFQ